MDFGKEGGGLRPRALHCDMQFLFLAAGVELDVGLAVGHRPHQAIPGDRSDFGIRRLEARLPGDVVYRPIRCLAGDANPLHGPMARQDEIRRRGRDPDQLDLRLLGPRENAQGEHEGNGLKAIHVYALGLVWNIAIASISISSSGRQRIA